MRELILLDFFKEHHIDYKLYTHEAVFTVEEAHHLSEIIPGLHSKNLFIKDKKKNYFLVSVLEKKRTDLKKLAKQYGQGNFSFCNPDELALLLKLTPGSVTPFGLIHDIKNKVTFLLDKDLTKNDLLNFHPLRNDMTVGISVEMFAYFFEKLGKTYHIIEIPEVKS